MSGYTTYKRWQRIEEQAEMLGFRLANPKHGWHLSDDAGTDVVSLFPKDDALPTYSRDAELFTGTFSEVEVFLTGWARAQQYDMTLRMSDPEKRKKFEAKEVERQRLAKEREEKRKMFAILADKQEEDVDKLVK
jgi:hypothetical protein